MEDFEQKLTVAINANDKDKLQEMLDLNRQLENSVDRTKLISKSLYNAVVLGHSELVEVLIQDGADVNYEDWCRQSVLMQAISSTSSSNEKIIQLLLERGANINHRNMNGQTDFMFLLSSGVMPYSYLLGFVDSVEDVQEHDIRTGGSYLHFIDQRPTDENKVKMLDRFLKKGVSVNGLDNNDDTPLHLIATIACSKSLRFLLTHGADIRAKNRLGETALHNLAIGANFENFPYALDILTKEGLDINGVDFKGRTILHHVLREKETSPDIIRELKKHGVKFNIKDVSGKNEIYIAVEVIPKHYPNIDLDNRVELLNFLANENVAVNEGDLFGITPLHLATTHIDLDTIVALIDLEADATKKTNTGATPLHWSCRLYNMAHVMIWTYLRNDHDVNVQDKYGSTALHWAVWYREPSVVQSLLQTGADVNIKDNAGDSPADLAIALHFDEFSELATTYKSLDPLELKETIECRGRDTMFACKLLKYVAKIDGKLRMNDYIEHIKEHSTVVKKFVRVVLGLQDMGLYYNIEENRRIPEVFKDLMHILVNAVAQRNPLFLCDLRLAGSNLEGTKVKLPDEFDYLWCLTEFSQAFKPVESDHFPKGFIKLRLADESQRSRFADFINDDDCLDCKTLLRQLYSLVNEELKKVLYDSKGDPFATIHCTCFLNDISYGISTLGFNFFGRQAKSFGISVDVVPTVWFSEWQPGAFPNNDSILLQTLETESLFSVVLKTPDRFHVKDFSCFFRVSYAYMEQRILKHIPQHVKKGYILLKALAESGYIPKIIDHDNNKTVKQYLTSYRFKTCFLHVLEKSRRDGNTEMDDFPHSEEEAYRTSVGWSRRIVDHLEECVLEKFLPCFFNPLENLLMIESLKDEPGIYDQDVFLDMIAIMKVILDTFETEDETATE